MRSCVTVSLFTSVSNHGMQIKTTIHQHALINSMVCKKKKKSSTKSYAGVTNWESW